MITKLRKRKKGFTLVELVIVIAIVIVLSVVSVPIYRSYVDKAKMAEGYALFGTILSAEKAYYSENGYFYENGTPTNYYPVLGIDVRGNKYFNWLNLNFDGQDSKIKFQANLYASETINGKNLLKVRYNITSGASFNENMIYGGTAWSWN